MSNRTQRLQLIKSNNKAMKGFYKSVIETIQGMILRHADPQGNFSISKGKKLRQEVRSYIEHVFLGQSRKPFTFRNGQVIPSSPYVEAMWPQIYDVIKLAVKEQQDIILTNLKNHPGVLDQIKHSSLAKPRVVKEFEVRPTVKYQPVHEWVHPDGYSLSDSVWRVGVETRAKLDALLNEDIALGSSARQISKTVETFLKPGEALNRTRKPYGTDGSFAGMRLARTEITSAHSRASQASASLNPFVTTYDVVLSASHPKYDECDEIADGGPYPKDDAEHLPPEHPHCLCTVRWNQEQDTASVIEQLQSLLAGDTDEVDNVDSDEDVAESIGSLLTDTLLDVLLNGGLL